MKISRTTRYQAAILRGAEILLIRHRNHRDGRSYWLLPGGGREPGESEIECVQREAQEETRLTVRVERLLLDEPAQAEEGGVYQRYKTYLCQPVAGDPGPGYEPEEEASAIYGIVEVGWFDLVDEAAWGELILNDAITAPALRRVRAALEQRG